VRLRADKMQPYTVTDNDVLWLARAVEAEGPIQSQVAGALVNGFCFQRSRGQTRDLTSHVRAYAQPVNPRWYALGDLFLKDVAGKSEAARKLATAAADRRERVHSTRGTFSAGTHAAVIAALNGRAEIPSNATDYAAAHIDATSKGYTPLEPPQSSRNRLWSRPGAEAWAGYLVDATDAWPWLVGVALVGFVVWRWWVV
jgi:hypothetical protein